MKLYCYSHEDFDNLMNNLKLYEAPNNGISVISITSAIDVNPNHWFKESENVINFDFNDVSPEMWWDRDYYDDTFSMWQGHKEYSNFFNYNHDNINLHAMDWNEAERLVKFIDERIKAGDDIYVHCSAGASRSQGVIRYILDTYYDINFETRKSNPCITPNWHIVRMLKRMYNNFYYKNDTDTIVYGMC